VVFILALVALTVMMLTGVSFMSLASQQLLDARRDYASLHALAMADTGISYYVWKQRYSSTPISNYYASSQLPADVHTLSLTGSPAPQVTPSSLTFSEDKSAVWCFTITPSGATGSCYEVISKGYYRNAQRLVRSVLQGVTTSGSTPAWLSYGIYSDAQTVVSNSMDITGDIGSNGSVVLNLSGGGSLNGNVRSASSIQFAKNAAYVNGNLQYGTQVLDKKGNDVTAQATDYCSGSAAQLTGTAKLPLDTMNPQLYAQWANLYGSSAVFNGTSLALNQVTTPIMYVNSNQTPGYTLQLSGTPTGPRTIFVNGDINLGNNTIGSPTAPVAVICTGNISANGNATFYGDMWANGNISFNGHETVDGSIRCNVASFQGNPSFTYTNYHLNLISPPNSQNLWTLSSWEIL